MNLLTVKHNRYHTLINSFSRPWKCKCKSLGKMYSETPSDAWYTTGTSLHKEVRHWRRSNLNKVIQNPRVQNNVLHNNSHHWPPGEFTRYVTNPMGTHATKQNVEDNGENHTPTHPIYKYNTNMLQFANALIASNPQHFDERFRKREPGHRLGLNALFAGPLMKRGGIRESSVWSRLKP